MDGGSLTRSCVVDPEVVFQQYDSLRRQYAELNASHSDNLRKLSEAERLKEKAIHESNSLRQQCTSVIRQWDSALKEKDQWKDKFSKLQQKHDEAIMQINDCFKSNKKLTEERDAALQEYSLIMSERDSVHRELEKLTDDLTQSKKEIKRLDAQNKELLHKIQEVNKEAERSKVEWRDWAFSERDKVLEERDKIRETFKALSERYRKERDRAVSDLAEALSESEDIRKQKNLASKQLKELRDKIEIGKENRSMSRFQYLSNSSFSESRDSAIDSDMHSGHYSIKLPNSRGADHGLIFEPGVYISSIVPGSPAAKEMNLNVGDRVLFINDTQIDNVQDALLALSEDIDPVVLTLSRSAGHLSSPINSNIAKSSGPNNSQNSSKPFCASNSSLRSEKSDPTSTSQQYTLSRSRGGGGDGGGVGGGSGGKSGLSSGVGLRDIFRVRLPGKKYNSPEEATLATLDSAIASGGGHTSTSTSTSRKSRKKRSSQRNSTTEENLSKNGTWPRMMLPRNSSCSYTLPQDPHGGNDPQTSGGGGGVHGGNPSNSFSVNTPSTMGGHHGREMSFYGQYIPHNTNSSALMSNTSNSVCIRRPYGTKERAPISNVLWDLNGPLPAKSVGAIAISGSGPSSSGATGISINSKSLTLAGPGRTSLGMDTHGLPHPPPQHRYSFGVFDPTPSSKIGKMPERNSVVPTLTMSDASSIDLSVKSGNMEILEYYVKRMVKNQNNSSESDHLDKIVTPPSIAIPSSMPSRTSPNPNAAIQQQLSASPVTVTSTLDRFPSRYRYPSHHHNILGVIPGPGNNSGTLPLSIPKSDNSFTFEPTYQHSHPHSSGNESSNSLTLGGIGSHKVNTFRNNSDDLLLHPSFPIEPSGTFPRKREAQRIRIPSNPSVTGSRSSTEKFELRSSPMPTYHIEVLDPGTGGSGPSDFRTWPRKPAPGEVRRIRIDKYDKSTEPLGIQIQCKGNGGGVFVSSVTGNSLASQVGLQVGDQLLEVCGINMRSATYDLAAHVLRQCGDSITMLIQYSPDKYPAQSSYENNSSSEDSNSHSDGESSSSAGHDDINSSMSDNESRSGSRSGSPTPCNSPQSTLVRNSKKKSSFQSQHASQPSTSGGGNGQPSSANSSLTKSKASQLQQGQGMLSQQQQQQLQQQFPGRDLSRDRDRDRDRDPPSEQSTLRSTRSSGGASISADKDLLQDKTRFLTLQLQKNSSNLGVCLVGGNVVGIYIHSVQPDSIADRAGLRTGDQILEYNGTDLRHATAEEAAFELAKPLDKVGVLVMYNLPRYNEIKDKPGDGFYIRALFDYPPASSSDSQHQQSNSLDPQQLQFHKDEILYVDNTMYNGKPGRWRAWKVDAEGRQQIWGVIPSKFKVEEDLMFKRSLGDLDGDRRSSTVTRRSFFRRKSHHRSSSRELASFSDFSINSYSDLSSQLGGLQIKDESASNPICSYQRVERLEYMRLPRPVIILGALSDVIAEKLCVEHPMQFGRVPLLVKHCSEALPEEGLVDCKRKNSNYECVMMAAIEEIRAKKLFCLIDVSTGGVERLKQVQMYPIVILVKFKDAKQIRSIAELDKKKASKLFEHAQTVEGEYKHLITACVPGGTNLFYLANQVKSMVELEQSKTLWVPS